MAMTAHLPGGLRRRRRRRGFGTGTRERRRRFYVLGGLLAVGVGLLLVPIITQLVESLISFDPLGYDPRDFERTKWINYRGVTDLFTGSEAYLSIAFLLLCALFFMVSRRD